jgi:hypothetical protein
MEAIRGRLAFYPNHVEVYEVADGRASPDEVIKHTDEGDGASQKDHWPPNVGVPHGPG